MSESARNTVQRKQDTLERLAQDIDAWIATSDAASGTPYLVPLSFFWDGATLLICNPADSVTSRNLVATGKVRIGIGTTRDVVLIEGSAASVAPAGIPDELAAAYAHHTGWDPRTEPGEYLWFRLKPVRIQAWREVNELAGRTIMRDGNWLIR